jgi:hypothetical protein
MPLSLETARFSASYGRVSLKAIALRLTHATVAIVNDTPGHSSDQQLDSISDSDLVC